MGCRMQEGESRRQKKWLRKYFVGAELGLLCDHEIYQIFQAILVQDFTTFAGDESQ